MQKKNGDILIVRKKDGKVDRVGLYDKDAVLKYNTTISECLMDTAGNGTEEETFPIINYDADMIKIAMECSVDFGQRNLQPEVYEDPKYQLTPKELEILKIGTMKMCELFTLADMLENKLLRSLVYRLMLIHYNQAVNQKIKNSL